MCVLCADQSGQVIHKFNKKERLDEEEFAQNLATLVQIPDKTTTIQPRGRPKWAAKKNGQILFMNGKILWPKSQQYKYKYGKVMTEQKRALYKINLEITSLRIKDPKL